MYINKHSNAIVTIIIVFAILEIIGSFIIGSIYKDNSYIFIYCIAVSIISLIPLIVAYHIAAAIEESAYKNYLCMNELYKLLQESLKNENKEESKDSNTDNVAM